MGYFKVGFPKTTEQDYFSVAHPEVMKKNKKKEGKRRKKEKEFVKVSWLKTCVLQFFCI